MDEITNTGVISCAIVVVLFVWKMINVVWLRPKKLEKFLRNQGINGNKYKFLFGDMKELSMMFQQSKSKHINIDDEDEVLPHIAAFNHQSLQKYGKSFITWMGWDPRVTIMDPEIIKDVLTKLSDFQKIRANPLLKYLATGLATYERDRWAKHRKLVNPAFHVEKLKNMVPAFHLSCNKMIEKWEKMISSNGSCELDVWPYLQALTCDVISRTAFGSSYEEGIRIFELLREQIVLATETLQSLYIPGSRFLPTKRNMRMKAIDKEVKHSIESIINNRLKAMKGGECNYDDLLGIMLESNIKEVEQHQNKNHGMTINEVIEECRLFYLAGQETTSSLLVWTMILLSKHQEWQFRAREEVLNVLGNKNVDMDLLNHLKVVNMIFYEVLRLYPPFVGLTRKACKDITLEGLSIPSGTQIALPVILIHYDEQLWGCDANKFNPERFSEGISKATKNQVIYFPFGWGPRICIGQNFALLEAKIALAMILQRFSFEFSQSYVHAPNIVLTLQPQQGKKKPYTSKKKMDDEKTQVRFGILGCAEIARKLCRAINLTPNSILHAISSRSIEKAKQFAIKNSLSESVKVYGSYEDVLDDPFVDAVYVPLPTSLHVKWAVLAAEKKKHVLLEKPTALNVGELDQILDACESNGVQFMDGSMWYHHPRTARMKEFVSDPKLFGQVKTIYSSSSFFPPPQFFENNIRTKAELDSFGALGDAGWYCIGAIMWAMNYKLPTTVTALPATSFNSNGVIMSTTVAFHWEQEGTTATFYCSFLSHETMGVSVLGSKGSFHVEDLIIPYEESSASFNFTSGACFVDLHIGWNMKEQEVQVHNELPQEAMMVKEFSRLVKGIKESTIRPDTMWGDISRTNQVILDAVKSSIDTGFKMVYI